MLSRPAERTHKSDVSPPFRAFPTRALRADALMAGRTKKRPKQRRHWRSRLRPMLVGSLLFHALLGLLLLLLVRLNPPPEPLPPPSVAMVFEGGSKNGPSTSEPQHGLDAGDASPRLENTPPDTASPPRPETPPAQPQTTPLSNPAPSEPPLAVPKAVLPPAPPIPPPVPSIAPRDIAPVPPTPTQPGPKAVQPAPRAARRPLEHATQPVPPRPVSPQPRVTQREPRPVSPFSSPMNLSFGNTSQSDASRASRSATHAAVGSMPRGDEEMRPVGGGDPGTDWANALSAWVEAHKYYPREAAEAGEEGAATVRVTVGRSGQVQSVELRDRSGSQWLDLAWQALFRGAHLPPFPPNAPEPTFTFDFTMHYVIVR